MDNSKVLKPIIGPQESAESKKKESNKKKKALIVSALAFLIATGTIATSVAIVKANMPKLEIKFDDWFVESFDFNSMQAFIDENRLSKGDIDKQLPGYVDKKAKDQNVKNADMITNARLTNKIPEDKNNKLPKGIYVEMTAEIDYAFAYQADLSLEENPDQQTKELSSITQEPKKQRYFITADKTKLYVLVYERESDSDEATKDDLQTFNDFHITNTHEAFNKLDQYIAEQTRRYTEDEFTGNSSNYEPGLEIFYNTLIGFEKQYISKDSDAITFPEEDGQRVVKIKLDIKRSNFYFDDNNSNVKYEIDKDNNRGFIVISGLSFFSVTKLNLKNLQTELQEYIKEFDTAKDIDRRYTLDEFRSHLKDDDLRLMILKSVGIIKDNPITLEDPDTEPETPEEPTPPVIDTSKINNMYMSNNNLVIDFKCDEKQKYDVSDDLGYDSEIYSFVQVNNRLTVKGLKYFIEYDVRNTQSSWDNLNKEIVDITKQYTVEQFTAYATEEDTQQQCKELIAKGLRANNGNFDANWISKLTVEPVANSANKIKLKIELDTEFKKYKTDDNEQFKIDPKTSSFEIQFTCFEEVEISNLQHDIQEIINADPGPRYTVEEFEENINKTPTQDPNHLKEKIKALVQVSTPDATNINNFEYTKESNELTFELTMPTYKKFPSSGTNMTYELLKKNEDDSTTYKVTISELKYWFDFEIKEEDLKAAKERVNNVIDLNAICVSTDPEDNNYNEENKQKIFDAFGKTPVNETWKLSQFMSLNDDDFKLENSKDFVINLDGKLEGIGKPRDFVKIDMISENITLDPKTRILRFNDFIFSTPANYFMYMSKYPNYIVGVTEKGQQQETLKIPGGYNGHTIDTIHNASIYKPEGTIKFDNTVKAKNVYFPDTIKFLYGGNLFYKSPYLETVRISKNCTNIGTLSNFSNAPNLTNIYWPSSSKLTTMATDSITKNKSLEKILLPRSFTTYQGKFFEAFSKETAKGKFIISWLSDFKTKNKYYNLCTNQVNMEAIIMLANELICDTSSSTTFPKDKTIYPKLKYYVQSVTVKNKLINEAKVPSEMVVHIPDLEQKLIQQGHIPADW